MEIALGLREPPDGELASAKRAVACEPVEPAEPADAAPVEGERAPAVEDESEEVELGAEPDDPLILELIRLNPTSVRLENAIELAAARGELPMERVSDYLAHGADAGVIFMRRVANLGRKSADELDALIRLAARARRAGPAEPELDPDTLRSALAGLFSDFSAREALAGEAPARLLNGLERLDYLDAPLPKLLLAFPDLVPQLLLLANCGRKSIRAAEGILRNLIYARLRERGSAEDDAQAAANALLAREAPPRDVRRRLSALFGQGTTQIAGAAEPGPAGPEPAPVPPPEIEPFLRAVLSQLDPRSCDVVERRYGLGGGPAQTLEEIGQHYKVTRERIRQIEAKAIRHMRQRAQRRLSASVMVHGEDAWDRLATGEECVLATELWSRKRALSPWFMLALDLCAMPLERWLEQYAQAFEGGWIAPSAPLAKFVEVRARLEARLAERPLPSVISRLVSIDVEARARAVLRVTGFHLHGDYVARERPRRRVRRALGLHALLAAAGEAANILDLVARYRACTPQDQCSARDAEIVMQAQKHLFIEVIEGTWAALGPAGRLPTGPAQPAEAAEPAEEAELDVEEQVTVTRAIADELRRTGPTRISEMIERAPDYLPAGRSINSIGPLLITNKDLFARPLPGFYALHDQVPAPEQLTEAAPAYLLQEDQVRLYALARRAGEPWGAYPLWTPQLERHWCYWARKHADTQLFESLLSVSTPSAWPDLGDRAEWCDLARARGRFSIGFAANRDALALPDLDRVLAAGLFVRQHGRLSWISANRVLLRRTPEHVAAGLLAVLIGLEMLAPDAPDWQAPHRAGPGIAERVAQLEEARLRSGGLDWDSALGRELKAQALGFTPVYGWVDAAALSAVFDTVPSPPKPVLDPLEALLAERAETARTAKREAVLNMLSGEADR